jgi:uncharacterized CHY-type Zn-finger protein
MTQQNICTILDSISSNAEYQLFPSDWYFLPNEAEGRAELASYLEDANNLICIKNAFTDINIITVNKLTECIYGSIGSSSSQIFVPRQIADTIHNAKVVNVLINSITWSIILISSNKDVNIFEILQLIYTNAKLPIAISNSIAHSFYGYNLSNIELVRDRPPSETPSETSKVALSLFDLCSVNYAGINANRKVEADKAMETETDSINKDKIIAGLKKITLNTGEYKKIQAITNEPFLKNTVVIPRFNDKQTYYFSNYTINNGWTGVLTIEGKELKDVGGGKTNPGLDDNNNITKIISGVKGEVIDKEKTFIPNAVAVLTGKIRSRVETEGSSCTSLEKSYNIKIIPKYFGYFEGSTLYDESHKSIISYELLKKEGNTFNASTSNPLLGGKRSRRRGKKSKKTRRKGKKSKKGKKGKGRRSRR